MVPEPLFHAELTPSLKEVVVFSDRAQLSFTTGTTLERGKHVLYLRPEGTWEGMLPNTLRVWAQGTSSGHVAVHDVRLKHTDTTIEVREQVRILQDTIKEAQRSADALSDKETVHCAVEAAVGRVEEKFKLIGERGLPVGRGSGVTDRPAIVSFISEPSSWVDLIHFLGDRRRHAKERLLELRDERTKIQAKLAKLQEGLRETQCGMRQRHRNATVEVTLSVHEQTVHLALGMSLVVKGASWRPLYDVRVSSTSSTMDLTYLAQVQQSTSLEWNKVQLKLSTATPHFGAHPPKLTAWKIALKPLRVEVKPHVPVGNLIPRPILCGMPRAARANFEGTPAPVEAKTGQAVVSSSTLSGAISSFRVLGLTTVRNDNHSVKVTVAKLVFPVELECHAVPKTDSRVFRIAKATNASPYTFLPGKSHILVDGTFLCRSKLGLVPAGAEFSTSVGVDDAVEVVRKEVRRGSSTVPRIMRTPLVQMNYVYEFRVRSLMKRETTLLVKDQCPLSSDCDVRVSIVEPDVRALEEGSTLDGSRCFVSPMGVVEWKLKLFQGSNNRVFRYSFQVEYPETLTVRGL